MVKSLGMLLRGTNASRSGWASMHARSWAHVHVHVPIVLHCADRIALLGMVGVPWHDGNGLGPGLVARHATLCVVEGGKRKALRSTAAAALPH